MANRQDQNTEDSYPREIDFEPEPELFDPADLQAEIWDATHPED
jgi:hypothetical protein